MKPLLGPEAVRKFHLGCNFHGFEGRLDTIFCLPTPEAAKENLLMKLLGHLMVRYKVEQQFRLPDLPIDAPAGHDEHEAMINAAMESN